MAYTFTVAGSGQGSTVFGNTRVQMGVLTADAASGVVSFGMATILHVDVSPKSATTMGGRFRINALAGTTASVGDLGVSGVTSGDEFFVTVYGR